MPSIEEDGGWSPTYWISLSNIHADDLYSGLYKNEKSISPANHVYGETRSEKPIDDVCWAVFEAERRGSDTPQLSEHKVSCNLLQVSDKLFKTACIVTIFAFILLLAIVFNFVANLKVGVAVLQALTILTSLVLVAVLVCYSKLGDLDILYKTEKWNFSTGFFATCFACGFLMLQSLYSIGFAEQKQEELDREMKEELAMSPQEA